jgi:glycerol-3-phosphate cytidylyltransferase
MKHSLSKSINSFLKMRIIITYGTFDLLHVGHINLLKRAKNLGDQLIVALSTDEFNRLEKNKVCINKYADRKIILESLRFVDLVIPEENWEQKNTDIVQHGASVFVMGDDWQGHFDFLKDRCEVIYLPRTNNISTTEIKNLLPDY